MTKLHQFHRIVENIRFTTKDLEALRSPYIAIDDAERNAERRGESKMATRHQASQYFKAKATTTTETTDSPSSLVLYICRSLQAPDIWQL